MAVDEGDGLRNRLRSSAKDSVVVAKRMAAAENNFFANGMMIPPRMPVVSEERCTSPGRFTFWCRFNPSAATWGQVNNKRSTIVNHYLNESTMSKNSKHLIKCDFCVPGNLRIDK